MATAGEMIKIIADVLARPQATVTSYYAVLRKAGMISTTGRGKSAQDLSSLDVARILIIMMSADNLQHGAIITELMGNCLFMPHFDDHEENLGHLIFEDALANIIEYKANIYHNRKPQLHPLLGNIKDLSIDISATPTHLTACINTYKYEDRYTSIKFEGSYQLPQLKDTSIYSDEEIYKLQIMFDGMKVTRSINGNMIEKIISKMP